MQRALTDLDARLISLEHKERMLAARVHDVEEWIDVVSSPFWKRIWFVMSGWRWKHLGRWY